MSMEVTGEPSLHTQCNYVIPIAVLLDDKTKNIGLFCRVYTHIIPDVFVPWLHMDPTLCYLY